MVYKSPDPSVHVPDTDFFSFLVESNEFNKSKDLNKPVIVNGETGESYSWNEVYNQSLLLATGWKQNVGLKKGDTVAVFTPNHMDHLILLLSLLATQCIISPGNPAYGEAEFEHQITNCQANAIVTVAEVLPTILKVTDRIGLPRSRIFLYGDKEIQGCRPFQSIKGTTPVSLPLQGTKPDDTAFICYSSGTTGLAKGVMLTHRNLIAQVAQTIAAQRDKDEVVNDVILGFLPFFHIYGMTSLVFNAYYKVTPVIIMPRYSLEFLCELIQKYKITIANIVPPVAVQLAKSPIVTNYDLSSIRIIICGAAPLNREHIETLAKRIPAKLIQGFGMTETTAGVISQKFEGGVAGSIGVLNPNIECKIINEEGKEVGDDKEGELLFRGPSIMKGYFKNDKANAETFTDDGWMRTGDVAKFDSRSREFFILDRIKELIKYKGFQVAPAELEAVLMGHDMVADCCVIGLYDASQATEIPRAYVVLQTNVQANEKSAKIIMDYVTKTVINYKRLRGGVKFVDAIPKSPSGKILRRQVKEWMKEEQKQLSVKARL